MLELYRWQRQAFEGASRLVGSAPNRLAVRQEEGRPMTPANCSQQAEGLIEPIIDRNRCEAKGDCVRVCPYDVFEIRALTSGDRVGMSLLGRIKAVVHGNRQAFAVHAEHCRACGLCVQVCPEKAIKLRSVEHA